MNYGNTDTLNTDQVAGYLRVSKDTVHGLASSGTLPAAKIGKSWVFIFSDV